VADKKIYLVTINGVWAVEIVKITFDEKDAIKAADDALKKEMDDYNIIMVKQYTLGIILYDKDIDKYKNKDRDKYRDRHCKTIYDKRKHIVK